jgi:hypothetical protein
MPGAEAVEIAMIGSGMGTAILAAAALRVADPATATDL